MNYILKINEVILSATQLIFPLKINYFIILKLKMREDWPNWLNKLQFENIMKFKIKLFERKQTKRFISYLKEMINYGQSVLKVSIFDT